jgi:hypothetical protein
MLFRAERASPVGSIGFEVVEWFHAIEAAVLRLAGCGAKVGNLGGAG